MEKETFISIFSKRLAELTESFKLRDKSVSENEFYLNHKVSNLEEEDSVTRELCEFVDTFYDQRKEYENSRLDADAWFEKEIDKIILELFPDATESEKEEFKRAVADGIDKQSEYTAEALRTIMKEVVGLAKRKEDCDEG